MCIILPAVEIVTSGFITGLIIAGARLEANCTASTCCKQTNFFVFSRSLILCGISFKLLTTRLPTEKTGSDIQAAAPTFDVHRVTGGVTLSMVSLSNQCFSFHLIRLVSALFYEL
jgi:hypothetical protein